MRENHHTNELTRQHLIHAGWHVADLLPLGECWICDKVRKRAEEFERSLVEAGAKIESHH